MIVIIFRIVLAIVIGALALAGLIDLLYYLVIGGKKASEKFAGTIFITDLDKDHYEILMHADDNLPDCKNGEVVRFKISHSYRGAK